MFDMGASGRKGTYPSPPTRKKPRAAPAKSKPRTLVLGPMLRLLRERKGLTQGEHAEKCNEWGRLRGIESHWTQDRISKLESGASPMREDTFEQAVGGLGMSTIEALRLGVTLVP